MFINRKKELQQLNSAAERGRLTVLFGRRRVGKTALGAEWGRTRRLAYTQAVEGAASLQISQLVADLGEHWPEGIIPRDYPGFLAAMSLIKAPLTVVIDEFPYLAASEQAVPSLFQKWVDHKQPANLNLLLLGSSQTMMHGLFLNASAPLYGRAELVLQVQPMNYRHYMQWLGRGQATVDDFYRYSLVGGIPKYWNFADADADLLSNAEELYFDNSARLENEPETILRDERIDGLTARSILEAIGRGAQKPSEIGAKLATPQTNLSRPLQSLMQAALVGRQLPFGESVRSSKRILYQISDPALRFWYTVYSPHRSRWHLYPRAKKLDLLRQHAGWMLEESYRGLYPDAARYWEGDSVEFDAVRFADESAKALIISEIKCRKINKSERAQLSHGIEDAFAKSALAGKYRLAKAEVLDLEDTLAALLS